MTSSNAERLAQQVQQLVPLLLVSDIEESRDFYRDGLGFRMAQQWAPEGHLAWCLLRLGGAAVMLQQACEEDPPANTWGRGLTLYIQCDNATAVYRELCTRGVDATPPTAVFYGMTQVLVIDPDGYSICFQNPTP